MFGPFSRYVRPYRSRLLLGVAAITCSQVASTLIPLQIGASVDVLQSGEADVLSAVRGRVLSILTLAAFVAIGG